MRVSALRLPQRPTPRSPGGLRLRWLLLAGGVALPTYAAPALAQSLSGLSGGGSSGGIAAGDASPGGAGSGAGANAGSPSAAGGFAATAGLALPTSGNSFILPATGVGFGPGIGSTYTGNIRSQLDQAFGVAPAARTPGLTVVPGIGVQELATDNVLAGSPRIADLVTTISPSILLGVDTQRLQANLAYAPNVQLYAVTGRQDQIDHELNAQATATLVPELLFLDVRGYATQQATSGGYTPVSTPFYTQQDRTQTASFSISPYVEHRLGDLLQIRAGYALDYLDQSGNPYYSQLGQAGIDPAELAALEASGQAPSFLGNNTLTHREFATLSTTPELGRVSNTLQLRGEQDSGTGVLDGAYRYEAVDDAAYAISRFVAVLGRIGYQDLRYAGFPVVAIDQAVWGAGLRLTPNPSSALVVRYGHHDGFDSAFVNASYALSARTRVFAGYSEGLTTDQEQIEDNLADSDVDQYGNTLDSHTAAPLLLTDDLLGLQNSLYHLRRFSATSITTYDTDSVSLNVLHESRSLVSTGIGYAGFSDKGTSAGVSWNHVLNETTTSTLAVQYGTTSYAGVNGGLGGSEQVFTVNAVLSHAFTPTISGTLQYLLTDRPVSGQEQGSLQNIALVGLRKTF